MRLVLAVFLMMLSISPWAAERDVALKKDSVKSTLPVPKETSSAEVERKIKTVYGIDGRPINQSSQSKGFHRVGGSIKLNGTGVDTVSLNTNIQSGRQDVTFIDQTTYSGRAWSLVAGNGNTYRIIPIGGNKFEIRSSSSTDTSTINFTVEGE